MTPSRLSTITLILLGGFFAWSCGELRQERTREQNPNSSLPIANVSIEKPIERRDVSPLSTDAVLNGRATYLPEPILPDSLAKDQVKGRVVVQILVGKDGQVVSATALFGPEALRPFAVEAALKAKIEPAAVSGQPTSQSGALIYQFGSE